MYTIWFILSSNSSSFSSDMVVSGGVSPLLWPLGAVSSDAENFLKDGTSITVTTYECWKA